MKVIQVQFEGTPGKGYNYYTDICDLKVGDPVLVMARGELALVKVLKIVGIPKAEQDRAHSLVIQKVDLGDFEERSRKLTLMIELKTQLKLAVEAQSEMQMYLTMAATNPAIMSILQQLREISPESVPALPEPDKKGRKKR